MTKILDLLQLPERHLSALAWFEANIGQEIAWPKPLPDGTLLAGRAKGIYKPAWSKYALSVRQSLRSPYPDRHIEAESGAKWHLEYFQEDLDPERRDSQFTNLGLIECWKDVIPVGVLVQTAGRPRPKYKVYGLALITGWDRGYFFLDGISEVEDNIPRQVGYGMTPAQRADIVADNVGDYLKDERREALKVIRIRQGQQGFRSALLRAYNSRCAISNYDGTEALEAAHILPYRGPVTNHPTNGILLRADLHNLFDLGLIAIDPSDSRIILSRELRGTSYQSALEGTKIQSVDPELAPSQRALKLHREWAGL